MSFLIKNATVVDGTSGAPYRADILTQSGRIMAVGGLGDYRADESLDASGMFAAPGFIDVVSYADLVSSPFADCRQTDYLKDGVTTVVIGHSGQSLAPIFNRPTEHNRDWGLWSDFIRSAGRGRFGVNFLSFVGRRNLSHDDERVSVSLLDNSLSHGALGLSFDFLNSNRELSGHLSHLAELTAGRGRLIAANLPFRLPAKDRQKILLDLLRAKRRGESSSRLHPRSRLLVAGASKNDINYLKRSRSLPEAIFGYNPYGLQIMSISSFLDIPASSSRALLQAEKHLSRLDPNTVLIFKSSHPFLRREILSSYARRLRLTPAAALLQIASHCPRGLLAFNTHSSPDWSPLQERRVFLSSLIAGGLNRPFSEFIGLGLKNSSSWTLPKIINRLTAAPAAALGLENDRGALSPGKRADIVLINGAGDISSVIVGGAVSFSSTPRRLTLAGVIEPYVYL